MDDEPIIEVYRLVEAMTRKTSMMYDEDLHSRVEYIAYNAWLCDVKNYPRLDSEEYWESAKAFLTFILSGHAFACQGEFPFGDLVMLRKKTGIKLDEKDGELEAIASRFVGCLHDFNHVFSESSFNPKFRGNLDELREKLGLPLPPAS